MNPEPLLAVAGPPAPRMERLSPWQMYFSFSGRITRAQFWRHGVLGLAGLGVLSYALMRIAQVSHEAAESTLTTLLLWPTVAISMKRWHDRDRVGKWVLVGLIPVVGQFWLLLDNGLVAGTRGPNRFGDDPRAWRRL